MSKLFREFGMCLNCFALNTANLTQVIGDAFFSPLKTERGKFCLSERKLLKGYGHRHLMAELDLGCTTTSEC